MQTATPPPLRRFILPGIFVFALFVAVFTYQPVLPPVGEPRTWTLTGETMGTTYTARIVVTSGTSQDRDALDAKLNQCLSAVDARMSTYREDSEVSYFNQSKAGVPFEASPELLEVLIEAERISKLSGGAFDVTVGPLVNAWGFGPRGEVAPPSQKTLEELVPIIGYSKLHIDSNKKTIIKDHSNLLIDLSSIAKGQGVDQCARMLDAQNIPSYMLEVGGEIRAKGTNAEGNLWRIGVEQPEVQTASLHMVVSLDNLSMATSGDYRNFYERDGVRLSHTIDPRTRAPIQHRLASVSVLHSSCMTADALATTFNVLGPEEGFKLAESSNISAIFLIKEQDGSISRKTTSAFQVLTSERKTP